MGRKQWDCHREPKVGRKREPRWARAQQHEAAIINKQHKEPSGDKPNDIG